MTDAKPQPYTFDLGLLLCNDSNPTPAHLPTADDKEAILAATARDCAQALVNQLLTTCQINRDNPDQALQIALPQVTTPLPREKPVPKDKEKSKWQRFAEKKGIKPKRRDGNLKFDDAKGEWAPKYGYKGSRRAEGQAPADWIEEVDMKAEDQARGEKGKGKGKGKRGGRR
ncbi:ribosomal biogenesis regulatory protein [Polychaeton citri CBS 116435]|uniref:Ribosome biogenesis regulatory protein n=1 Tax=Polychaeton citri CBS 116435 TaxID=1314669 RepID=A0A9P4Q342_9PEZI|nr:ribosomal biogenesis regulatory protein [Polychaeton citri CBS 116435]